MQKQDTTNSNDDNVFNQILTELVARGCTIITELQRLIELVPTPFKTIQDEQSRRLIDTNGRYLIDDLTSDFKYFRNIEAFESRIESNEALKKADQDIGDAYIGVFTRFYLTFESIQRYANDLNHLVSEVVEDNVIGQSIESILSGIESRQLFCEAYFNLGYMLILTDTNFEGNLRERLIVSYYRYSSNKSSPSSCLDLTCNLMRSTGFRSHQQQLYRTTKFVQYFRPDGYPESFFRRVEVDTSVVNILISKLQAVDIYNQTSLSFVHPDHRSAALAQQASMVYVILYFCPNILNSQRSRMREIADKFYYDNWIISVHMGDIVNLIEAWNPYRAARESLHQLFELDYVKSLITQNHIKFRRVSKKLNDFSREGWLNEDSILENSSQIFNEIREANFRLKWMLLQTQTNPNWQTEISKNLSRIVLENAPTSRSIFELFQSLATLEEKFGSLYSKSMEMKCRITSINKLKAIDILNELIEIFSDIRPTRWIQAGSKTLLVKSLKKARDGLEKIEVDDPSVAESLIKIIRDLESAQESHFDGQSLQVLQLFSSARVNLMKIYKSLNFSPRLMIALGSVSEMSYVWRIMDNSFKVHMQQKIKDNPLLVHSIEPIFKKLASAFDNHLLRLQQLDAREDLFSLSRYYSAKLMMFTRDILHIIPIIILESISSIMEVRGGDGSMCDVVDKISVDQLREFVMPDKRFKILELTHKISHYADSMLKMGDTTVGLVRVNSKRMLEDGMRQELASRMLTFIRDILKHREAPATSKSPFKFSEPQVDLSNMRENLMRRLRDLDTLMNGYKRSFEYIQDYIGIYGLRIWQEELDRMINSDLEQANIVLHGVQQQVSENISPQADYTVAEVNSLENNFIYRILRDIIKLTDPRLTFYDEQTRAWFKQKARNELVMDRSVFVSIQSSLSVSGLNALNKLSCTLLKIEVTRIENLLSGSSTHSSECDNQNQNNVIIKFLTILVNNHQLYESGKLSAKQAIKQISSVSSKLSSSIESLIDCLLRVIQIQAIRREIKCVISINCRSEARNIFGCLNTLNDGLLALSRSRKFSKRNISSADVSRIVRSSDGIEGGGVESNQHKYVAPRDIGYDGIGCTINDNDRESVFSSSQDPTFDPEDSRLMLEISEHLDWIGLSDIDKKIYSLDLENIINKLNDINLLMKKSRFQYINVIKSMKFMG